MSLQHGVLHSIQLRKVIKCGIKYSNADNSRLTIILGITGLEYICPIRYEGDTLKIRRKIPRNCVSNRLPPQLQSQCSGSMERRLTESLFRCR